MRRIWSLSICLFLILTSFVTLDLVLDITSKVKGTTHYAGGGGNGNYSTIQEAINYSSDGDTVYVFNGTYYENVVVNKTINLIGENRDTTIIDGGEHGDVITINVDWVNLTGFTVIHSGKGPGHAGIELTEVQECRIYGNNITNNSYGIYLSSSNYNNITNNYLFANTQPGIYVSYSIKNNINSNIITYNSYGIHLSSSNYTNISCNYFFANTLPGIYVSYSIKNNINSNNFLSNMKSVLYQGLGINLYYSNEASVSDNMMIGEGLSISGDLLGHWNTHNIDMSNTVNGKPLYYWKNQIGGIVPSGAGQIILANCSNVKIQNQTLNNCSDGIRLGFSSNNNISNNYVFNTTSGIYLWNSHRNNITGNNVSNNVWGIMTKFSNANNITSNILSNNADGIFLRQSNGNNMTNNTAYNNYEGINLQYSNYNEISGNYVFDNKQFSLMIDHSDYNNITSNTIFRNYVGIYLYKCGWNKIIGNTISYSAWYGIKYTYELNSCDNRIYHNNFICNAYQAYDDYLFPFRNRWDNGYPDGGNFWSDYRGIDQFNGPDQDINGSDGIGDSPRGIAINSMDLYPLKAPFGDYIFLYQGWNLISIPFIQSDTYLRKVLGSIESSYDAIQSYNATDSIDHWKHNVTKKPSHLNDLDSIYHTMGFWIHIIEPGGILFQYPGTQPLENQTISLNKGWNLVGYPSITNHNRTIGLNNLEFGVDVNAIQWYDAATKTWRFMGPDDSFFLGKGYWVHSKVEASWEVLL